MDELVEAQRALATPPPWTPPPGVPAIAGCAVRFPGGATGSGARGDPGWAAVAALEVTPDIVLVDATGRDHPRRAGLGGGVADL